MTTTFQAVKQKRPLRWWKIIFLVLSILIVIPVLIYGVSIIAYSISSHFEEASFRQMDSDLQSLYDNIKYASHGSETWSYDKSCEAELTGDWPTGKYFCSVTMTTEIPATSPAQLTYLHDKYFSVIDRSAYLQSKSQLNKQFPEDFGIKFVVSGADKKYALQGSEAICTYLVKLAQPRANSKDLNYAYGSDIDDRGTAIATFICQGLAMNDWYK